MKKTHGC